MEKNIQNILLKTLARAEYAAPALRNAVQLGAKQYVDFNTHLAPFKLSDTQGLRHSRIFLSKCGRISQLEIPRFAKDENCFCNMLGLAYHTPLVEIQGIVSALGRIFKEGSTLVLDCPDCISFEEMEKLFSDWGFLIYEYITADEIQARFLDKYNKEGTKFMPVENINFIMAVKKTI